MPRCIYDQIFTNIGEAISEKSDFFSIGGVISRCTGLLGQCTPLGETITYKTENLDSLVKKNGLQDRIGLKQI